tara:strand:+ start:407 stop:868 length:462 start_codon:yes stop_codon:yes gene_type:complete
MEFEGVKFKYENDMLYRWIDNKKDPRNLTWVCCNNFKKKYKSVKINYKDYGLHRLVYKYHNPNWDIYNTSPNNFIDHIDRDTNNNKIENLRIATARQNCFNRGAKGYTYRKKVNKYEASIKINGKSIYLGRYNTKEEAHNKYLEALNSLQSST